MLSHETFFDDFQTVSQASSPNDDGGEPSGRNIGFESDSNDTAKEQSSNDDQESVQIDDKTSLRAIILKIIRYGLNKFVNHTWLSAKNCGFIANINKIFEPKSYEEAALDRNWVQAINEAIHALYENNTWDLVELPRNRRAIGSKGKSYEKNYSSVRRYVADPVNVYPERGKLIQKLLFNQKCMGYLVRAYYNISPTMYYKDDSSWSADLKSRTTEDIISIGSFIEVLVLNHYVLVRKILAHIFILELLVAVWVVQIKVVGCRSGSVRGVRGLQEWLMEVAGKQEKIYSVFKTRGAGVEFGRCANLVPESYKGDCKTSPCGVLSFVFWQTIPSRVI
nr:ribonuclease H-like domain-containing protein [Tanacetum cinerariifolium]